MLRTTLWLLISLFVVSAYAQDSGTFSGRIITRAGSPIEGATITLPSSYSNDDSPLAQTTTDLNGKFTLVVQETPELPIHRKPHAILIEADNYAATYVDKRHLTLFPGSDKNLGEIVLDTGRTYSGRVVNGNGDPMDGAKVVCGAYRHYLAQTVGLIGREFTVTTDSRGFFQTPPLSLGVSQINVLADGYLMRYYDRNDFLNAGAQGQLPDLALTPDTPIHGVVRNELGEPVANAKVEASFGVTTTETTDREGRFVLRGFGERTGFQLQMLEEGYVFVNLSVSVEADGLTYYDMANMPSNLRGNPEAYQQAKKELSVHNPTLEIVLRSEGQIRGRVVDAGTDEPISISRIVLCSISRKPDGEMILDGCRDARFVQPSPGEFLVGYADPGEYHLAVSAEGYADSEAITPLVFSLEQIDGIVVKMTKKGSIAVNEQKLNRQQITGALGNYDSSLEPIRVALWRRGAYGDVANAFVTRGRTTVGDGYVLASTLLENGRFSLDVPYQDGNWYVLVETPHRIVAIDGPINVAQGETKSLEIVPRSAGALRGIVTNHASVPTPLYAILFSDLGVLYETAVHADGSFQFTDVYPGDYGLKIGCDSILDSDIPGVTNTKMTSAELRKRSDPWKRAKKVTISESEAVDRIEIAFER